VGGKRSLASKWATHLFVLTLLLAILLVAVVYAHYGDGSPRPCNYDDDYMPGWVATAMFAPFVNATLWLLSTIAYFLVPGGERARLRAGRWSAALGSIPVAMLFFFGSFGISVMFFDCDH